MSEELDVRRLQEKTRAGERHTVQRPVFSDPTGRRRVVVRGSAASLAVAGVAFITGAGFLISNQPSTTTPYDIAAPEPAPAPAVGIPAVPRLPGLDGKAVGRESVEGRHSGAPAADTARSGEHPLEQVRNAASATVPAATVSAATVRHAASTGHPSTHTPSAGAANPPADPPATVPPPGQQAPPETPPDATPPAAQPGLLDPVVGPVTGLLGALLHPLL